MSDHVDILIPTYRNARRLKNLVSNIEQTAGYPHKIVFITEADDEETAKTIAGMEGDSVIWITNDKKGRLTHCLNLAYRCTQGNFLVITSDDVLFSENWLRDAVNEIGSKGVLAFSDKNAAGWGHFLVKREYIENYSGVVDEPGQIFHEYRHEYADAEFQFTARQRGQIVYSNIAVDHRDPKYFGAAYEENGEIKPIVKTYVIRDHSLRHVDINVGIVENQNNPKELILRIDLVPKNPIVVNPNYLNNNNKSDEAKAMDYKDFSSRAHLWGGQTVETIMSASQAKFLDTDVDNKHGCPVMAGM